MMKSNNWIKSLILTAIVMSFGFAVGKERHQGFAHKASAASDYVRPTDPKVLEKLEKWRDLKFGVLIHWGLYSKPGIVESWSICSEDVDWITRKGDMPYNEYKEWYWGLKDSLNPVEFDPGQWAEVMDDAGMRYAIFTTKHHDGFCMYDSKLTDFSIAHGPFSEDPRKDVARHVFDAFRNKGFMAGCYFSKPDWHCEWFWNPEFATPNRNINYKKERHPDWWKSYVDYTAGQLEELTEGYGPFDILWLDGGWISGDEIGLDDILSKARERDPGLICVDRSIRGKNENYHTPERGIPSEQLDYPWESCITLSNDWGWVPDAPYKSPEKVIGMLAEIVAKGGCLALGVGPTAEGTIEEREAEILREIGKWLKANGEAIYGTRVTPLYNDGNVWFTASKDGETIYAIHIPEENDNTHPDEISWHGNIPNGGVVMLDGNRKLKHRTEGDKVTVALPRGKGGTPVALKYKLKEAGITQTPLYLQSSAPTDARVADLLERMTVAEKVGQLRCPMGWEMYERNGDRVDLAERFKADMSGEMPSGVFWAVLRADPWTRKTLETGLTPGEAASVLNSMQKFALEKSRLGIPLLFAEECPHGHMAIGTTVFPTGLGMGSTWNRELLEEAGRVIALEARLQGANIGYGPVLDLARDPRWSRMEETLGEDPVLTGQLGSSIVRGMQGDDAADGKHLYSTLKHFAAYGMPEGGHNGAQAHMGLRELYGEYLPPFRTAVEAGASTVMTSYNSIDGVPCSGNKTLLDGMLRDKWGFRGAVFSDLFSIDGMTGRVASGLTGAAGLALEAGVDIDLGANAYSKRLVEAVEQGRVEEALLDSAVAHVLRLKFDMGLFENPYVSPAEAARTVGSQEHRKLAREVARQGIVLLKNDGKLPLDRNIGKIAVIGPNADTQYNQLGDYTAPQAEENVTTVLEGIREAVGSSTEVTYVKGCAIRDTTATDIDAAVKAAADADAVVLVVGGSSARDFRTTYIDTGAATVGDETDTVLMDMDCGEGYDRNSLDLLGDQNRLMKAVMATGKPVVVVYIEGRPLDMNLAAEKAAALLAAWYPGGEGGAAVADILFGDYNPSGRLPVSVPRSAGQLPVYYSAGTRHDYMDGSGTPLYPFGYGLSYTTFDYSDLEIAPGDGEDVLQRVACTVKNTGARDGREVVQLYLRDKVASVAQPAKLLKGFHNIELRSGESKRVTFDLRKHDLSIIGLDYEEIVEPGEFEVMVGSSSQQLPLRGVFTLGDETR